MYWDNSATDDYLTSAELYENEDGCEDICSFPTTSFIENEQNISHSDSLSDKEVHIDSDAKDDKLVLMNYLSETDKCRFEEFKDVLEVCHWAIENNIIP